MDFIIPGCNPDPPKRVSSKMIHLTYAALEDGELTFDQMLGAAHSWGATRQSLRVRQRLTSTRR